MIEYAGDRLQIRSRYLEYEIKIFGVLTLKSFCQYMGCSYGFDWVNPGGKYHFNSDIRNFISQGFP